jgi:hypothetical protein
MLVLLQMSSNWLINQLDEVYFTYDLNAEFILLPQDKLVHIFWRRWIWNE